MKAGILGCKLVCLRMFLLGLSFPLAVVYGLLRNRPANGGVGSWGKAGYVVRKPSCLYLGGRILILLKQKD